MLTRKKRLIGELVFEFKDEMLSATENSLDDTKVIYEKINCPIDIISLVIIFLLCHY